MTVSADRPICRCIINLHPLFSVHTEIKYNNSLFSVRNEIEHLISVFMDGNQALNIAIFRPYEHLIHQMAPHYCLNYYH